MPLKNDFADADATATVHAAHHNALATAVDGAVPKSTVTAKGDLVVATASGTVARQGIGADGQVLTADAAQTNGLKWAAPAATGVPPGTLTAKGDLFVATASGVVTRQPVGTNGQVLVADSTVTNGIKYTNPGGVVGAVVSGKGQLIVGTSSGNVTPLSWGGIDGQVLTADTTQFTGLKWAAPAAPAAAFSTAGTRPTASASTYGQIHYNATTGLMSMVAYDPNTLVYYWAPMPGTLVTLATRTTSQTLATGGTGSVSFSFPNKVLDLLATQDSSNAAWSFATAGRYKVEASITMGGTPSAGTWVTASWSISGVSNWASQTRYARADGSTSVVDISPYPLIFSVAPNASTWLTLGIGITGGGAGTLLSSGSPSLTITYLGPA